MPFSFWLNHDPLHHPPTSGEDPLFQSAAADAGPPVQTRPASGVAPATGLPSAPCPEALQQAMSDQLAELGHPGAEPLRWAITAVDARRGLRIEGIGLVTRADQT